MLIYGDGEQTRAFSYINDVLPCFWEAAERPEAGQEIINLGGANPVSIKDAATACARITGGAVKFVEGRHEVKYAYCTTQKSEQLLGYNETTGFEDGLMAMWEWTKWAWEKYPDRRGTHKITDIEVEKGLYSYWRDYI
jgi:UDP-glucose 4-epimerase